MMYRMSMFHHRFPSLRMKHKLRLADIQTKLPTLIEVLDFIKEVFHERGGEC
jgi:hypothetical protein